MGHTIETFSNVKGGNSFYKAVSHPAVAGKAAALVDQLSTAGPVALYDPLGLYSGFAEFHDTSAIDYCAAFVQDIEKIGTDHAGMAARPVTELPASGAKAVFIAAFDVDMLRSHIAHLIPDGATVFSLDDMRLDDDWLTNRRDYLSAENFATNYAFFREKDGLSTRVATANYWSNYGARGVTLHLMLFDETGSVMAGWSEDVTADGAAILIDSARVRDQFDLPEFTGQLFIHVSGVRGHDVVKYALDIESADRAIVTCTHDANAWPSDQFAGLPAPQPGEDVVLWVQNSHPCPIPAGDIGLNLMGDDRIARLEREIPPFGTYRLSVGDLLPDAEWPQQIEVQAGKHFVRPRYEITGGPTAHRMAHVNVERVDLKPDPGIAEAANLIGKGFILPAPILPAQSWRSIALPTPMSTTQATLPLAVLIIDPDGKEIGRHEFGCLPRNHAEMLDATGLINGAEYGHMELVYDFNAGTDADGWLHGLFRYENRETGHAAETSFGAHVFNTVLTYKNEPQSYSRRPPGLSTRLFLRVGPSGMETFCHLVYPASTPWHGTSDTALWLTGADGVRIAEAHLDIPCGGSRLWRVSEIFDPADIDRAGNGSYVIIRDTSCRLFGYHGLMTDAGPFSLDHMFGF